MLSWDNLGSAPGQNYSIYRWEFVLLLAKGLPRYALDLIALMRFADMLFGDHQTEPGNTHIVGAGENQKIGMRGANGSIGEDSRKERLREEALILAKLIPLGS